MTNATDRATLLGSPESRRFRGLPMPGLSQTRIVRNNPPCAIGLSASVLDGFPDHAAGQSGSRIALSYCPAHRHERLPEYAAPAYSGNWMIWRIYPHIQNRLSDMHGTRHDMAPFTEKRPCQSAVKIPPQQATGNVSTFVETAPSATVFQKDAGNPVRSHATIASTAKKRGNRPQHPFREPVCAAKTGRKTCCPCRVRTRYRDTPHAATGYAGRWTTQAPSR